MNPLSSQKNSFSRLANFFLAAFMLASAFLGPVHTAQARSAQPALFDSFARYGFEVAGFSPAQEQIIRQTLQAYAQALGGPVKLRQIITTYNGGKNRKITYNPNRIGAGTAIELSPTVFSLQKSNAANYSIYGAAEEAAHAQVVIGHEIGHLLIWAAERETGVNWSSVYAQQVHRNWTKLDPTAPMEEAVTNLSLKVSDAGYFFSLNQDRPETDPRTRAEIAAWTVDFLAALRRMK